MIKNILFVGVGSCLGGIARYLVSVAMKDTGSGFPWATLIVNLLGCLLIGILWATFNRTPNASSHLLLFLTVGFCGAFTTFSTFSKENLTLLQSGNYAAFFLYSLGSVVLGILAVAIGFYGTDSFWD
jgi:CrcB protein